MKSLLVLTTLIAATLGSLAQGTAFTYQGRLNDGPNPANGSYDLTFSLWKSVSGLGQRGTTLTNTGVAVSNGLLTVTLDFGATFPGEDRWLEIAVRTNTATGGGTFTTLVPRQHITSAPYAITAISAGNVTGPIDGSQITAGSISGGQLAIGTITVTNLANNSVTASQLATGAAAANLNASGQSGVASSGLILSATANNAALVSAGYVKLGPVATSSLWLARTNGTPPSARYKHTAVWTGSEMIVWGGANDGLNPNIVVGSGARYNPVADSWTATAAAGAPAARQNHTAVWTGNEMIVWGGNSNTIYYADGARYNPAFNSWTPMTTNGAPLLRCLHTAIWTGSKMIIWGGNALIVDLRDGGSYNPSNDTWTAVNTVGAPLGRESHTAIWTGTEMIVWGGQNIFPVSVYNTGGRYNPLLNSWTALDTSAAPAARYGHTAIWTGSEMIVWGGNLFNTGGRYNPANDTWAAVTTNGAPSARYSHSSVWTGSEMIVWGGFDNTVNYPNTGGHYNPSGDYWSPTASVNPPAARANHTAVWTGSEMLVWGGFAGGGLLNDTFSYTPGRVLYLYQRP